MSNTKARISEILEYEVLNDNNLRYALSWTVGLKKLGIQQVLESLPPSRLAKGFASLKIMPDRLEGLSLLPSKSDRGTYVPRLTPFLYLFDRPMTQAQIDKIAEQYPALLFAYRDVLCSSRSGHPTLRAFREIGRMMMYNYIHAPLRPADKVLIIGDTGNRARYYDIPAHVMGPIINTRDYKRHGSHKFREARWGYGKKVTKCGHTDAQSLDPNVTCICSVANPYSQKQILLSREWAQTQEPNGSTYMTHNIFAAGFPQVLHDNQGGNIVPNRDPDKRFIVMTHSLYYIGLENLAKIMFLGQYGEARALVHKFVGDHGKFEFGGQIEAVWERIPGRNSVSTDRSWVNMVVIEGVDSPGDRDDTRPAYRHSALDRLFKTPHCETFTIGGTQVQLSWAQAESTKHDITWSFTVSQVIVEAAPTSSFRQIRDRIAKQERQAVIDKHVKALKVKFPLSNLTGTTMAPIMRSLIGLCGKENVILKPQEEKQIMEKLWSHALEHRKTLGHIISEDYIEVKNAESAIKGVNPLQNLTLATQRKTDYIKTELESITEQFKTVARFNLRTPRADFIFWTFIMTFCTIAVYFSPNFITHLSRLIKEPPESIFTWIATPLIAPLLAIAFCCWRQYTRDSKRELDIDQFMAEQVYNYDKIGAGTLLIRTVSKHVGKLKEGYYAGYTVAHYALIILWLIAVIFSQYDYVVETIMSFLALIMCISIFSERAFNYGMEIFKFVGLFTLSGSLGTAYGYDERIYDGQIINAFLNLFIITLFVATLLRRQGFLNVLFSFLLGTLGLITQVKPETIKNDFYELGQLTLFGECAYSEETLWRDLDPKAKIKLPIGIHKVCPKKPTAYYYGPHLCDYKPRISQPCVHNEHHCIVNRQCFDLNSYSKRESLQYVDDMVGFVRNNRSMLWLTDPTQELPLDQYEWIATIRDSKKRERALKAYLHRDFDPKKDGRVAGFIKKECITGKFGSPKYAARLIQATDQYINNKLGPYMYKAGQLLKENWKWYKGSGIITYASGLNRKQLGKWYDDSMAYVSSFGEVKAYESDFSKFDKHHTEKHLRAEFDILNELIRMPDDVREACETICYTKGYMPKGVVYEVPATRKSGFQDTTLGNTILNGVSQLMAMCHILKSDLEQLQFYPIRMIVLGDDMYMLTTKQIANEFASSNYLENLGWDVKKKVCEPYEATFCSSVFMPSEQGTILTGLPGRMFAKTFCKMNRLHNKHQQKYYCNVVAKGIICDNSHNPLVHGFLNRLISLTQVSKPKHTGFMKDWFYRHTIDSAGIELRPTPEVFEFIANRYGISIGEIIDLHNYLTKIPYFQAGIRHSVLDKIISVDLEPGVLPEDMEVGRGRYWIVDRSNLSSEEEVWYDPDHFVY